MSRPLKEIEAEHRMSLYIELEANIIKYGKHYFYDDRSIKIIKEDQNKIRNLGYSVSFSLEEQPKIVSAGGLNITSNYPSVLFACVSFPDSKLEHSLEKIANENN